MSHFARVTRDGVVQEVIVADQEFIDSMTAFEPGRWIQCSFNTKGGIHIEGGTPLRYNYPSPGYTYDDERDAFIPPRPSEDAVLNEETCLWETTSSEE